MERSNPTLEDTSTDYEDPLKYDDLSGRKFKNLQDISNFLAKYTDIWKNGHIQDGREQGIAVGTAIGRAQGIRQILLLLLEDRFGTLPRVVTSYIDSSDAEALISFAVFANNAPSVQVVTNRIISNRITS